MAQEYTITKISEQEPRTYNGEYGTTYYIKVMLHEHNKPVEIGKKDPNALKIGDKVYGDIRPTTFPTDNFKAARRPFGAEADMKPILTKLDAIQGDLKLLMRWYRQLHKGQLEADQNLDKVVEPTAEELKTEMTLDDFGNDDDEVNLDDIPF